VTTPTAMGAAFARASDRMALPEVPLEPVSEEHRACAAAGLAGRVAAAQRRRAP
jgi:hypothetical protein